jgi:hypothetical protein
MADDPHSAELTQQTRPKKGEPVTIPVPEKGDVMDFLEKAAHAPVDAGEKEPAQPPSDS